MPAASPEKTGPRSAAALLPPAVLTLLGIAVNAERCILGCAVDFDPFRFFIACAFVLAWIAAAFLLGLKRARRMIAACAVFGAAAALLSLVTAFLFSRGLDAVHFTMIFPSLAALFPMHGFFPGTGGPHLWYAAAAACAGIGALCAGAYFAGRRFSLRRR